MGLLRSQEMSSVGGTPDVVKAVLRRSGSRDEMSTGAEMVRL